MRPALAHVGQALEEEDACRTGSLVTLPGLRFLAPVFFFRLLKLTAPFPGCFVLPRPNLCHGDSQAWTAADEKVSMLILGPELVLLLLMPHLCKSGIFLQSCVRCTQFLQKAAYHIQISFAT